MGQPPNSICTSSYIAHWVFEKLPSAMIHSYCISGRPELSFGFLLFFKGILFTPWIHQAGNKYNWFERKEKKARSSTEAEDERRVGTVAFTFLR